MSAQPLLSLPLISEAESRATVIVRRACWSVATLFGLLTCLSSRNGFVIDGLSYLDIGDAYFSRHWHAAVNAYWSPLYSWIIGAVLHTVHPQPRDEYWLVEAVMFIAFLGTLWAFEALLREVMRWSQERGGSLSEIEWRLLAYTFFVYAVPNWISHSVPDLLAATVALVAARSLLRMRTCTTAVGLLGFGALLGVGYFAKTAMFLAGWGFVLTAALSTAGFSVCGLLRSGSCLRHSRDFASDPSTGSAGLFKGWSLRDQQPPSQVFSPIRFLRNGAIMAAGFLAVSAPFVIAVSHKTGRLTFGQSGALNYRWFVNDKEPFQLDDVTGIRKALASPAVYVYNDGRSGSYPLWYAPAESWSGLNPVIRPGQQIRRLLASAKDYYVMLFHDYGLQCALLALVVLLVMSQGELWLIRRMARQWDLLLPAVIPFALYALVYTEPRFFGGFLLIIMLALMSAVAIPAVAGTRKATQALIVVAVLFAAGQLGVTLLQGAAGAVRDEMHGTSAIAREVQIADALHALGVRSGDHVASVGTPWDAYWARLAGVQIVAEMPNNDGFAFASATSQTRQQMLAAFASGGARAVVVDPRAFPMVNDRTALNPAYPVKPAFLTAASGWYPLGTTGYYAKLLGPESAHSGYLAGGAR